MLQWLSQADPVFQAFVATLGTYGLTALGTVPVLFFRSAPRALMDSLMGFAAGVMVAASCWSLLIPAIDIGGLAPAVTGLLGGATTGLAPNRPKGSIHLRHSVLPTQAKMWTR